MDDDTRERALPEKDTLLDNIVAGRAPPVTPERSRPFYQLDLAALPEAQRLTALASAARTTPALLDTPTLRHCRAQFCATNSLARTIPACICQVHRLLAAD